MVTYSSYLHRKKSNFIKIFQKTFKFKDLVSSKIVQTIFNVDKF